MIRFNCPHCGKPLSVKEEAAGKAGKCPACAGAVQVPQPETVNGESAVPAPPPPQTTTPVATPPPLPHTEVPEPAVVELRSPPPLLNLGPRSRVTSARTPAAIQPRLTVSLHGLGIASLVSGILSFFTCCIPFIGLLFGALGLAAGITGIVLAIRWKQPRMGLSIAGTAVSLPGLLLGIMAALGLVSASASFRDASQKLAEAEAHWVSGNKEDAVSQYRSLLTDRFEYIRESDRPTVFQRLIEHDVEQGNLDEAKRFAERAQKEGVSLSLQTPQAQTLVNQVQAEIQAKLAEQRAAEAEAKRVAEQRTAQAEAQAVAQAENEIDADGLVLLKNTVRASGGEFGGEITGTVVNRRSREVGYAQISFKLFDRSGAQVGTALDNINSLEAGGKWKFKATTFGTDFDSYKFDSLQGF